MTDKKKANEKPVRVQFPRGVKAEEIADAIKNIQTEWALKYPERAHKLYPTVFDEQGKRIKIYV